MSTLQETAIREASEWSAQYHSGKFSPEDNNQWELWLESSPANQEAWAQVEELTRSLKTIPSIVAHAVVDTTEAGKLKRRQLLKNMVLGVALIPTGYVLIQKEPWLNWRAEYKTAVGDRQTITLSDASVVELNTNTALDIDFNESSRVIHLHQGEILVSTGHLSNESRPFFVETGQGSIQALGTRFSVYQEADSTQVNVYEDDIVLHAQRSQSDLQLSAGQTTRFTQDVIEVPRIIQNTSPDWSRGILIANDRQLGSFLNELSRYRPGLIRYSDEVARLRISGSFPLVDTDLILNSLAEILPVNVQRRTDYWVSISLH